jgi:hypothetical protein
MVGMCRVLALFLTTMLSACLSSDPASFNITWPVVDGPYYVHLTRDDIWQIVQLARHHPNVELPVTQIDVKRPDLVHVHSGNAQEEGQIESDFDARKKNGRWLIIEGSIYTQPLKRIYGKRDIIVTGLTSRFSQPLHRVQPHFPMTKTHSFQATLAVVSGG